MHAGHDSLAASPLATREPPPREAPSRLRTGTTLAAVLLACLAVRVWMAWHAEGIARDGHTYVRMARQWWHDPAGVIHGYAYHPGYPALVATLHHALGWADTPSLWQLAGILVAGTASILAMLATWLWGRMAFGPRTACIATLLFGLTRKWCVLGADVLSDSLALCFMVWSLLVGAWAGQELAQRPRRGLLLAALSGLLGGLGYFVRPEAALVPCLVGVMLVAGLIRRGQLRTAGLTIGIGGAAVAAMAIPYMLFIGDVTKKKRLLDMLNPAGLSATLPAGLGTLVRQFFEAIHPVLGALLCVWLLAYAIRRLMPARPGSEPVRPTRPMGPWMLTVVLFWAAMLLALFHTAGYISNRHVMFLALVLSPLAGQGLVILADGLAVLLGKPTATGLAAWALTLPVAVGLAVHALDEPLHQGSRGYEQAATRLAELAKPGQGVLTDQRAMEVALRDARSDWQVARIEANQLERWRRDLGFSPRQSPKAEYFMLPPNEMLAAMDHLHSPWVALKLPRQAPQVHDWLADLRMQAGILNLGTWPIAGTDDAVHLLACETLFCRDAVAPLAELAQSGQGVLTNDRAIETVLYQARKDLRIARIEAAPLERWRLDLGFSPRQSPKAEYFMLPPNEMLAAMDQLHSPWVALKLPAESPRVQEWLADLRTQAGIVDLGAWPIPGTQDEVHVLALKTLFCRETATRLAGLAQPGQGVLTNDRAIETALREIRSDLQIARIEAEQLERWRLNVGFPPRQTPKAGHFVLPPNEMLAAMDHLHSPWVAITLPRGDPEVQTWLTDLLQVGIVDLGTWPIPGTQDEVHLLASQTLFCHDLATRLAQLAQPGQGVLTNDRAIETALRETRSDLRIARIEAEQLERWRLNIGFPSRQTPKAGHFVLPPNEMFAAMDHLHSPWVAIKLPCQSPQVRQWLDQLVQAGIDDLGAWPIPNTQFEVHLLGLLKPHVRAPGAWGPTTQPAAGQ